MGSISWNKLINVIDFLTIASTGNAIDFGDILEDYRCGGASPTGKVVDILHAPTGESGGFPDEH